MFKLSVRLYEHITRKGEVPSYRQYGYSCVICAVERNFLTCPSWKLNPGRWIFRQTLYHVAVKAGFSVNTLPPGRVAQSVTCLATNACLTAIPGVASSIPAWSHTFVEIDHEIISTVILLPSADSFKKGCCQLQAKVCARITGYPLVQACPGKNVVR